MRGRRDRSAPHELTRTAGEMRTVLAVLCCAADGDAAFFDTDMHYLEARIAAPEHHQRSFDALADVWCDAVAGWDDLDTQCPEVASTCDDG